MSTNEFPVEAIYVRRKDSNGNDKDNNAVVPAASGLFVAVSVPVADHEEKEEGAEKMKMTTMMMTLDMYWEDVRCRRVLDASRLTLHEMDGVLGVEIPGATGAGSGWEMSTVSHTTPSAERSAPFPEDSQPYELLLLFARPVFERLQTALAATWTEQLRRTSASDRGTGASRVERRANSATSPCGIADEQGDHRWSSMYQVQKERLCSFQEKGSPEVLVMGDSLVQQMERSTLWKTLSEKYSVVNFGIGGDQTQHLLHRLSSPDLAICEPKTVTILIGTNNHGNTAFEVFEGILAVLDRVTELWPSTRIFLLGLLPRGRKRNTLRFKLDCVNRLLAEEEERRRSSSSSGQFSLIIAREDFVQGSDQEIPSALMWDYLHLTDRGYDVIAKHLLPPLTAALSAV